MSKSNNNPPPLHLSEDWLWWPFLTRELRACARASGRYDVGNGIRVLARSLARLVDSCKLFSILRFGVHLIVFGEQKTNEMVTFVAKNSGGVTKKPTIILKEFFFSF